MSLWCRAFLQLAKKRHQEQQSNLTIKESRTRFVLELRGIEWKGAVPHIAVCSCHKAVYYLCTYLLGFTSVSVYNSTRNKIVNNLITCVQVHTNTGAS